MEYISGFSGMPFLAERAALTLDGYDIDTSFKNIINSIKNIESEEVDIVSTYNTINIDSETDPETKKKTFAIDVKDDIQFGNYVGKIDENTNNQNIELQVTNDGWSSTVPPINQGSDIYLNENGELRMKNGWYHVTMTGYITNLQVANEIRYITILWSGGDTTIDYDASISSGKKYFNIGFDVYIPGDENTPSIRLDGFTKTGNDPNESLKFTKVTVFKIGALRNTNSI